MVLLKVKILDGSLPVTVVPGYVIEPPAGEDVYKQIRSAGLAGGCFPCLDPVYLVSRRYLENLVSEDYEWTFELLSAIPAVTQYKWKIGVTVTNSVGSSDQISVDVNVPYGDLGMATYPYPEDKIKV
mmetsp:Transcript_29829/g.34307  ORF Transcript_29829/g.34307 Transcript_29829/m.34307 type:complete len:127 (+) Transcript_29829:1096-1476(+)